MLKSIALPLPTMMWNRAHTAALAIAVATALLCGWLLHGSTPGLLSPEGLKLALQRLGGWGPVLYMAILAVSVVVSPVPGAPLAVVAGMVWGMPWAGIYSVIGGFLGSLIAYFLGRTLGHAAIRALTGKRIYVADTHGHRFFGWLIFFSRLLPVLPFDVMSYGAGMVRLSFRVYAIATLLGMIPSTFLLSYAGQSMTTTLPQAIAVGGLLVLFLVGLPWTAHRYNWFGFRDLIRVE
jgi:uncharacterized membrane protein YdjX (TVP38/TMEM64 family)